MAARHTCRSQLVVEVVQIITTVDGPVQVLMIQIVQLTTKGAVPVSIHS